MSLKMHRFFGKGKTAISIDTKKYRYWIYDWKIEKFPIHHVDNHFCFEHSYLTKLFYDSELKVMNLKRFWKGFQPKLTPKDIQMLINKIELLEEDIECVHLYLDNIGIDRKDGDKMLSIVGRLKKMNNN